jgi:hypothetical protein
MIMSHKLCMHGKKIPKYASVLHNSLHSNICDIIITNVLERTPLRVYDNQ